MGRSSTRSAITVNDFRSGGEAFSIASEGKHIFVNGGDARGMVYGTLALVEYLESGVRLEDVEDRTEAPQLEFRAIKHNLPWDSYRPRAALDQHLETTRDLAYWEAFLDMMVENRFDSLTLWTLHPWQYMISPRNFPEASPVSAEELGEWRTLHDGIFHMAKERGPRRSCRLPARTLRQCAQSRRAGKTVDPVDNDDVDATSSNAASSCLRPGRPMLPPEYPPSS